MARRVSFSRCRSAQESFGLAGGSRQAAGRSKVLVRDLDLGRVRRRRCRSPRGSLSPLGPGVLGLAGTSPRPVKVQRSVGSVPFAADKKEAYM